jgi:potassium efflux system protein
VRRRESAIPRNLLLVLCLLFAAAHVALAESRSDALPASLVTEDILHAEIAAAEAATDLNDETRERLIELYRESLRNLEIARSNQQTASKFQEDAESAPSQIQELRAGADQDVKPLEGLDGGGPVSIGKLEQLLQEARAALAAVQARHADFEARLTYQEQRPVAVSARLEQAGEEREATAARLFAPSDETVSPTLIQARRWELETRHVALSNEIKSLDQELLMRPLRINLLAAKRDKAEADIERTGERVRTLANLVDQARRLAAEQARGEAELARREAAGEDPILVQLSERNAALSENVSALTAEMRALDLERERVDRMRERIEADFRDARSFLESGRRTARLGQVLAEQRESLPDLQTLRSNAEQRKDAIAETDARRLSHRAEARRIENLDVAVSRVSDGLHTAPNPAVRARIRELLEQRQNQLERALETNDRYAAKLNQLNVAEETLLRTALSFEDFLLENLLWLRNAQPVGLKNLMSLPDEVQSLLLAPTTLELRGKATAQLASGPLFWMGLVGAVLLLWRRKALITSIQSIAGSLGKPTTDRFGYTARVLVQTALVAAPMSLLLAGAGWTLLLDADGTDASHAVGDTLTRIGSELFTLRALHAVTLPQGLAAAHFRWSQRNVELLRVEVVRLTWLFIPAATVVNLTLDLNAGEVGGTLGKLGGAVAFGALSWFLFRVFHPRRGVLADMRAHEPDRLVVRTYFLWYPVLVAFPLLMILMAFSGFVFAAVSEAPLYRNTLLLIVVLVLVNALALRWLQVSRQRLAYEAALERRRKAAEAARRAGNEPPAGSEVGDAQFEEPEVDITALSDDARGLIRIAMSVAAIVGLYLIWHSVLPALRIFEDVVLWHETKRVDGAEVELPVTLANLGLAVLYAAGAWILARRLPALLELILMRRCEMNAASRYTVTTLSTYAIVVVGILIVLGTLGASWSQLQWLAAALTVGIGFGLQEIVANFISGIIILFERPIRVGDTVTVGDTDGVVTRIQIRATTIRNFDRKELLVPNKEFITGRLLNWSLSDPVTRVVIVVGVAYGSDVDQAKELMRQAAENHPRVVNDPAPFVTFDTFGDNALTLTLRAYVDAPDVRLSTITDLNGAINQSLSQAGIGIAFPQRDVHLDSAKPLRVRIEGGASED